MRRESPNPPTPTVDVRIEFTIPGKPVAQGRPRFYRKGSYVVATDPQASKVYKADIAYVAQRAREEAGVAGLFEGPLGLRVVAYFPCPKSKWRKRVPRPEEHHDKRPDADNLAKAVKDGLSGVLYHDDGQVAELVVRKRRAAQGDAPRVEVCLYTLDPLGD
ncbi:MAG TPA: RusA family crossover junction endodeoxyribonuclease [Candidatus Poseidoniales archaeon]|nr:RusA family crossover junction endodeoxyribonuclease [Candidatus Poseidoniales archaeon]